MKRSFLLFLCLSLSVFKAELCAQETASEETIPVAYLVLDASSSMWGRIDGRPKIELAKEVITKIISGLPKKVNAGFTVYGHRRAEDCQDIEEISPLGILDKSAAFEKLKAITPRGKSPLTAAIKQVLEKIKGIEGPKTIILVSDGVESCQQDPCALVKEYKSQGVDFKIEVIGLNVSEDETVQLHCLADESGGSYQYIKSSGQLNTPPPAPTTEIIPTPPLQINTPHPSPTPDSLSLINRVPTPFVSQAERGRGSISFAHDPWLLRPLYWRLIDPATGGEAARSREFELGNVPAGEYVLAWRQYEHGSTEVIVDYHITVHAGKNTEIPLYTAIRLNIPAWVRPPRFWGLQDPESKEQIAAFTPFETFLVPPGEYELIWRQYENRADTISFGRISIERDKINYVPISSSITPETADWVNLEPYYWGLKTPDTDEYVARFYGRLERQLIPEGRYDVIYRLTANEGAESILGTVDILSDVNSDFTIDSGVTFTLEDKSSMPRAITLDLLDDKDNSLSSVKIENSLGPVPLRPGRYKIHYQTSGNAKASELDGSDTITLKQGELVKINLDDIFHHASVEKKQTPQIEITKEEAESISTGEPLDESVNQPSEENNLPAD